MQTQDVSRLAHKTISQYLWFCAHLKKHLSIWVGLITKLRLFVPNLILCSCIVTVKVKVFETEHFWGSWNNISLALIIVPFCSIEGLTPPDTDCLQLSLAPVYRIVIEKQPYIRHSLNISAMSCRQVESRKTYPSNRCSKNKSQLSKAMAAKQTQSRYIQILAIHSLT